MPGSEHGAQQRKQTRNAAAAKVERAVTEKLDSQAAGVRGAATKRLIIVAAEARRAARERVRSTAAVEESGAARRSSGRKMTRASAEHQRQ